MIASARRDEQHDVGGRQRSRRELGEQSADHGAECKAAQIAAVARIDWLARAIRVAVSSSGRRCTRSRSARRCPRRHQTPARRGHPRAPAKARRNDQRHQLHEHRDQEHPLRPARSLTCPNTNMPRTRRRCRSRTQPSPTRWKPSTCSYVPYRAAGAVGTAAIAARMSATSPRRRCGTSGRSPHDLRLGGCRDLRADSTRGSPRPDGRARAQ